MPDSIENVSHLLKSLPPSNVTCLPMTWETGLKNYVSSAKLVLHTVSGLLLLKEHWSRLPLLIVILQLSCHLLTKLKLISSRIT